MKIVVSRDGTKIAYDQSGSGFPLIIIGGAFSYRKFKDLVTLGALLSGKNTIINYDRRGRDDSGNTLPYSVTREVEDIEALIDTVGGSAYLFGLSSGGALALEAANAVPEKVKKVMVYEVPYLVDDTGKPMAESFIDEVRQATASGDNSKAVKMFLPEVGMPKFMVNLMPLFPAYKKLKELAPTLPYDLESLGNHRQGRPFPEDAWSKVTMPTLIIDGGKSPISMRHAMEALARHMRNATYKTLPGQTHMMKPAVVAPVLDAFLAA